MHRSRSGCVSVFLASVGALPGAAPRGPAVRGRGRCPWGQQGLRAEPRHLPWGLGVGQWVECLLLAQLCSLRSRSLPEGAGEGAAALRASCLLTCGSISSMRFRRGRVGADAPGQGGGSASVESGSELWPPRRSEAPPSPARLGCPSPGPHGHRVLRPCRRAAAPHSHSLRTGSWRWTSPGA